MSLSDIVTVDISLESASVVAAGFGVPLIAGASNRFGEAYRNYTKLADMLSDGFLSTDPEYKAASALLSQKKKPPTFVVGKRAAVVAQVDTITPVTPFNSVVFTLTIDGTAFVYTADSSSSAAEVVTGLHDLIIANEDVMEVLTPSGSGTLILTGVANGPGFSVSSSGSAGTLTVVHTTANHSIADDLQAFRDAGAIWYGTEMVSRVPQEVLNAAAWIEANSSDMPVTGLFQTSEAASGSAARSADDEVGTDLLNLLMDRGYTRSSTLFHSVDGEYADAAWLGRELPVDPGSDNWALKELIGITPSNLSATYKTNIKAKNGNYYYAMTPANNITTPGKTASGDWIDIIRFIDFLKARISEAIANVMLSLEKVEFDDRGLQLIGAQVSGVLQQAKNANKLVSFNVVVPLASSIPSANRAARTLDPPITFEALLSGALNNVAISGTVSE